MTEPENWLANLWHRIAAWVNGSMQTRDTVSTLEDESAIEQVIGAGAKNNNSEIKKGALRFESARVGFLVPCASCASLHELNAVCYRCGLPLCSDETNCRLSTHLDDIGESVFICPSCNG